MKRDHLPGPSTNLDFPHVCDLVLTKFSKLSNFSALTTLLPVPDFKFTPSHLCTEIPSSSHLAQPIQLNHDPGISAVIPQLHPTGTTSHTVSTDIVSTENTLSTPRATCCSTYTQVPETTTITTSRGGIGLKVGAVLGIQQVVEDQRTPQEFGGSQSPGILATSFECCP